jgi:hypothetical protein
MCISLFIVLRKIVNHSEIKILLFPYFSELGFQTVAQDYQPGSFYDQNTKTFSYYNWDLSKTRGCVCDAEYGDVDCSKRMCPYGTDVMDIRQNTAAAAKYQVQQIDFVADSTSSGMLTRLRLDLCYLLRN